MHRAECDVHVYAARLVMTDNVKIEIKKATLKLYVYSDILCVESIRKTYLRKVTYTRGALFPSHAQALCLQESYITHLPRKARRSRRV